MKYSRRVLPKYRPCFYVEDMRGQQISADYDNYNDVVAKAREMSCYTRGGVRIGVVMPSFKVVGARFESEV